MRLGFKLEIFNEARVQVGKYLMRLGFKLGNI